MRQHHISSNLLSKDKTTTTKHIIKGIEEGGLSYSVLRMHLWETAWMLSAD